MPWSEVSGIFWSCPYVALTAKEIMKVPTRSTFGGDFFNWILFVCHVLLTDLLGWGTHQGVIYLSYLAWKKKVLHSEMVRSQRIFKS